MTLNGFALSMVGPFIPLFGVTVVRMTPLSLGVFLALSTASAMLVNLVVGRMSDARLGYRRAILMANAAGCVGYLAFAFLTRYYLLLVVSVTLISLSTVGFGQVFAYARQSLSAAGFDDARIGINTLRMLFAAGWAAGPALAAVIVGRFGFGGVFLATASGFAVMVLLVATRMREQRQRPSAEAASGESVGRLMLRPVVIRSVITFTLINAAMAAAITILPLLMVTTVGGTRGEVGLAFSIAATLEIPVMLWLGWTSRRLELTRLLLVGSAAAGAYYLGLALVQAPWQIIALQPLSALVVAIFMTTGLNHFQSLAPRAPGTTTALYSNAARVGSILGSLIAGGVGDRLGFRFVYAVCLALALGCAFTVRGLGRGPETERLGAPDLSMADVSVIASPPSSG